MVVPEYLTFSTEFSLEVIKANLGIIFKEYGQLKHPTREYTERVTKFYKPAWYRSITRNDLKFYTGTGPK